MRPWLLALLAGCGEPAIHPVGVRTEAFTYGGRSLVTEIWYPAQESGTGEVYAISDFVPEQYRSENLGGLATEAVRDAKPARGPYPLILFSHGNAGMRVQSTFLTVELASRGYVVAAPDHAGNTLADFLTDSFDLEEVLGSYRDRPIDLGEVIDGLESDEAIDFDRIGVVGHSFGAVTALRSLVIEPRIRAAVSQAPAGYDLSWFDMEKALDDVGAPVMLQAGGLDRINPDVPVVDSVWAHVTRPGVYARFPRAGHFTFSDFCLVSLDTIERAQQLGLGDILDDGCGPENVPYPIAHDLIDRLTISFFDLHLKGETSEAIASDEVTIEER